MVLEDRDSDMGEGSVYMVQGADLGELNCSGLECTAVAVSDC